MSKMAAMGCREMLSFTSIMWADGEIDYLVILICVWHVECKLNVIDTNKYYLHAFHMAAIFQDGRHAK